MWAVFPLALGIADLGCFKNLSLLQQHCHPDLTGFQNLSGLGGEDQRSDWMLDIWIGNFNENGLRKYDDTETDVSQSFGVGGDAIKRPPGRIRGAR